MIPTLRKLLPHAKPANRPGVVAFGAFLGLGLMTGFWLGNVVASQTRKKLVEGAAAKAAELARETSGTLEERARALKFLATAPTARLESAAGPIRRFRKLYPEFASITIERGPLEKDHPGPVRLAITLPDGRHLLGVLKEEWVAGLLAPEMPQNRSLVPVTSALVGPGEPISADQALPPARSSLRSASTATRRWSDGHSYVTLLKPLRSSTFIPGELAIVKGIPERALSVREGQIRQRGLVLGLVLGVVPGALAWFGIARSTRRLRASNRKLEERVVQRTEELATVERSFRDIFENVPLGLYQCDANGRFLRVNPELARMFGFSDPEEAVESLRSLSVIGHRADRADFLAKLKTAGRAETMLSLEGPHGRTTWIREKAHAVCGPDGRLRGFEGVVNDVTEQLALEAQLRQIGATDPLTGLLNRRGFQESIEKAEFPATVVVLDVDRFKEFNDTYGHPAGDRALRMVADAMRLALRNRGILARTGGEEFAVFLPEVGLEEGLLIAQDLRNATEACPIRENMLTVSGGASRVSALADIPQAIEAADRALYSAKQGGRNRIVASATSLI